MSSFWRPLPAPTVPLPDPGLRRDDDAAKPFA